MVSQNKSGVDVSSLQMYLLRCSLACLKLMLNAGTTFTEVGSALTSKGTDSMARPLIPINASVPSSKLPCLREFVFSKIHQESMA